MWCSVNSLRVSGELRYHREQNGVERLGTGETSGATLKKCVPFRLRPKNERSRHLQVVAFMNMKGGVGKTTLAVNVAYGLAYFHKKRVLIVDVDPQFNATQYLMETDEYLAHLNDEKKGTVYDIFVPKRPGPLKTTTGAAKSVNKAKMNLAECSCSIFSGGAGRGKLDLIPSTLGLMELETSKRGTESKLKAYISEKAQGYDYVILDCPPTISIFTQAAILASDKYVVPIKPDPLSIIGLPLLERWLEEFTEDHGLDIESVGLVFTLVRGPVPRTMRAVMDELREAREDEVFKHHLSMASAVAQSVDDHLPIFRYRTSGKTTDQMIAILQEFVDRTS
jgi:chromosome partitioning protein